MRVDLRDKDEGADLAKPASLRCALSIKLYPLTLDPSPEREREGACSQKYF